MMLNLIRQYEQLKMDIHAIEKTCQEKMNIFIIKIQTFLRRHVKIDPEFIAVMKEF
eukprot:UN26225